MWTFGSDSTPVTGTAATATPNAPGVPWNRGDLLLALFGEGFGSHTISPIAGWTDLSPHINVTSSLYVFGKLATATNDPMPTATYSGSTNFWCYSVAFAGASSTLVLDSAKGDRATNSVSTIPGLASTPTPSMDNCLGIWWGGRNKTTTSNGATLSTSNPNYVFQKQLVQLGSGVDLAFLYWIQTTATANAPTSVTSSISDPTTQSAKMMNFFIQPPTPMAADDLMGQAWL